MKKTFGALFVLLCLGIALGCRTVPVQTDFSAEHADVLAAVATRPNVAPGSDAERAAIARVKQFLGGMTAVSVRAETTNVYAPDAYLNDTLKTVRGPEAIQKYFEATMEAAESVTATFEDVTRASDGTYYFRWVMDVRMKSVAKGKTIRTIGISQIRFDEQGRILLHQDYWDSTAGLFQQVPALGTGIRAIKARL
ncbi:MAG: nuclear transport factor 2 family protein [Verrucomicrobia bacterium]|nr:MAG: nuclear transport factor 2 family protein [Verrucomicrobiota bacterium]